MDLENFFTVLEKIETLIFISCVIKIKKEIKHI